jgi:hypothetical protein
MPLSIRILAFGCLAAFVATSYAQTSQDSMGLARQTMRCSLVYGMGAAAEKTEEKKKNLLAFQSAMVHAASKLGGTPDQLKAWQDEFTQEFMDATGKSDDPSKRMKNESFMPSQIGTCEGFVKENWPLLTRLFDQH